MSRIDSVRDEARGVYVFSRGKASVTLPIDFVDYWGFELQGWVEAQIAEQESGDEQ